MKVNFVIAGAQKAGTSALYHFLSQHQQICMSNLKECHFFDNDDNFLDAPKSYDVYHANFLNFQKKKNVKIYGEATPVYMYMYWHKCPERLFQYNQELKIVLILRNPIERAISHWSMNQSRGLENRTFSESIRSEKIYQLNQDRERSYLDRGFYSLQIKRLLNYFPPENILAIKTEDLFFKHDITLKAIINFLNLDNFLVEVRHQLIFKGNYQSKINHKDRKLLQDIFSQEIAKLESLLKWDLEGWV